ncbi:MULTISPECIES: potassium transporter Kup [unclassified Paracoccus (in: a-proteobacteria)]|uniref:potassium transporter Kup n=1 Tax=unclassified Paracoccus (in: a-proteobacteria) TaxID=2688777 RepID=UPI001601DA10|nr:MULTISPECIES: potassium transporter Kup [unclassified Paracoccus (in: a-proteobacteria)]MBB1491265.1 potassium transporter Kup [Paracoccus sp. MC1854]MBB1498043.1 potassium transporter Kup [Paracoccus sp. MC1862]QQO43514.1 potassium transporter Kup [Paracoccus sp. MC1862]
MSEPAAADLRDPEPSDTHPPSDALGAGLVLACLGVVFGDIGTSPLYALRESLVHAHEHGMAETAVIGIVSMLFWTVMLIVTLKYVTLILRADNNGEGGTLSLVAKAQGALGGRRAWWLYLTGIVGVSLFFGDAMITPAMSVMAAIEGMELVVPHASDWVVPVTLVIVIALFWVQRSGTEAVARLFGPVMLLWFGVMGVLGASHILDDARILQALNPLRAAGFIADNGYGALPVMGSVFLAVTGAEALYADMGHFGRRPVRISWLWIVLPALTLAYAGQGAMVLSHPERAANPFFLMAPNWFLLPLVLLATAATVIASQAVISGAFSVAQQAVQLGLVPRLEIQHTSDRQAGQIYLPRVNTILMVGVCALVLAFGSSSRLASAYGIAVTGDMVITSVLAIVVFRYAWGWRWPVVLAIMLPILGIELVFLYANLLKVPDGGYIPLLFAAVVITFMGVWMRGTQIIQHRLSAEAIALDFLAAKLEASPPTIVPGTAVFLTADPSFAPPALMHNLKHNRVLHERNYIVKVETATTPTVPDADRFRIEAVTPRFWRLRLRFGYMEQPNVPRALALGRAQGHRFEVMSTSYFLNRRSLKVGKGRMMPVWASRLYAGMYRSASEPTNFYRLPTNRVVELGQQLNI